MFRTILSALAFAHFVGIASFSTHAAVQEVITSNEPETMAQNIADFVRSRGGEVRLFNGYDFYLINVRGSDLSIDYYSTNRDLSDERSARDSIADTLILGTPKIFNEVHMIDDGADQTIDLYQVFYVVGGLNAGFTREERDRGEVVGVEENIIYYGKFLSENGWVQATDEDLGAIQDEYLYHLRVITSLLP